MVDENRVHGALDQVGGAIKEGFGKLTGDKKTEAEGAAQKASGKVENAVGGVKDSARETLNK